MSKPAAVPVTREWLSGSERDRLRVLEDVVERGIRVGIETGRALKEIRDTRLYREAGASFEDYCKQRFGLTRRRIDQFIDAAAVVETVSTTVPGPVPSNERVARELAPMRDDPEAMKETWDKAVESHGPTPTSAQVRAIRQPQELTPAKDVRFELIDDAVALLKLLPDPNAVEFPVEPGDVEVLQEALAWLAAWTPKINAAWKQHLAAQRQQRSVA